MGDEVAGGSPAAGPTAAAQPPADTAVPTEEAAKTVGETAEPTPEPVEAPTDAPPAEPVDAVGLQLVAEGFTAPMKMVSLPDGGGRVLVVDQVGVITLLEADGSRAADPFLDIRDKLVNLNGQYDERGLLGLALHPRFAENGRFFVYYSAPPGASTPPGWANQNILAEYRIRDDNPLLADPGSERVILRVDEPQPNHNGGDISFGPDGYLYVPLGDGGGANDTGAGHNPSTGNGQDRQSLLGKILRIDIDNDTAAAPYAVPADNPFVNDAATPDEIWALGFRNPWRVSWDRGAFYVSDVGQNLWEEVSRVEAGGNYGWNLMEGTHCFDPARPNAVGLTCAAVDANGGPLIGPLIEYPNAHNEGGVGEAVIGGYVYRGQAIPGLIGTYVFGDWDAADSRRGIILAASVGEGDQMWAWRELPVDNHPGGEVGAYILSFGQDEAGEMYVLTSESVGPSGSTGRLWKIVPPG